jgi:hypothetical protein
MSLLRKNHFRIYNPADPMPFVYAAYRYIARNASRLIRIETLPESIGRKKDSLPHWLGPDSAGSKP